MRRKGSRVRWLLVGVIIALAAVGVLIVFDSKKAEPPFFVNSEGIRFIRITAGAPAANAWVAVPGNSSAVGAKPYSIDHAVYITETDITQEQYLFVVGHDPGQKHYDSRSPVQQVTLKQALDFCWLLSNRDGRQYRLPTPAEWKYVLYSGQNQPLTPESLDRIAWYAGNSGHHPHPVRLKLVDRWGLYDMLGNVRQWCCDPKDNSSFAWVEGADYLSPASECLDSAKLETRYLAQTVQTTIGFRVVYDSADQQ
jgi:formylglycine-generating enzyme required for sulfatase activity